MQTRQSDETADDAVAPEPQLEAGDLRSVERLLASLQKSPQDPFVLPQRPAQQAPLAQHSSALQSWALQPLPSPPIEQRGGFLAWLFLTLGLMAFACGGVMLAWSAIADRDELWSFGIPLALGGQAAIIFGLAGLAEAAGQRQKQAATALEDYRQRFALLQNLALTGQSTPPARRAA